MSVECFLDTNVLVYAVSSAPDEATKKAAALKLIGQADFGLSAQVLQEFYVTVTRKIARPMPPDAAISLIEEFRKFPFVPTDYPLIVAGVEASLRFGVAYWDGAIIAAAYRLESSVLYSEDLSDGRVYGSLRVINPFRVDENNGVHDPGLPPYG